MANSCLDDFAQCQWDSGKPPFCCSGFCNQGVNEEFGFCKSKKNGTGNYTTTTTTLSPLDLNPPKSRLALILVLSMLAVIIFLAIVGLFLWYRKNKKPTLFTIQIGLTSEEIKRFLNGNPDPESVQINKPTHEIADDIPYDRRYEIPENSFTINEREILGEGAFGLVYNGILYKQNVAVKTVKPNVEKTYLKSLLTELKILIHLGEHENVVGLLGAFTSKLKSGKLYVFLELCPQGNLLDYLKSLRESTAEIVSDRAYQNIQETKDAEQIQSLFKRLINFSMQIANGLRFLSDKKVIHGDVSARNVLVFNCNQLKLTDFGLSRRLYEYTNYVKKQQEPLPWRWLSIESLRDLSFSTQSDIWSFGVCMWEIFSLGQVPYPGLSWNQDFIYKLIDGFRLSKPEYADDSIFGVMTQCWKNNPKDRGDFQHIYKLLSDIHEQENTTNKRTNPFVR